MGTRLDASPTPEQVATYEENKRKVELKRSFSRIGNYTIVDEKHLDVGDIEKSVSFLYKVSGRA